MTPIPANSMPTLTEEVELYQKNAVRLHFETENIRPIFNTSLSQILLLLSTISLI